MGWETFGDSVKFTWDSTFADALGPRDAIEIKSKSNTDKSSAIPVCAIYALCAGTAAHRHNN